VDVDSSRWTHSTELGRLGLSVGGHWPFGAETAVP